MGTLILTLIKPVADVNEANIVVEQLKALTLPTLSTMPDVQTNISYQENIPVSLE